MSELTVTDWARRILTALAGQLENASRKRLKPSQDAQGLHKIRTRARRLRSALEDLQQCSIDGGFLADVKRLGDKTGMARDGQVLLQRLHKYRRIAQAAERSQIDRILRKYKKRCKRWDKVALDAIAGFHVPSQLR